jgi:hypothetical protein
VAPSIRKSWQSLRRQAVVDWSVQFARGLRPWSFFFRDHANSLKLLVLTEKNNKLIPKTKQDQLINYPGEISGWSWA